MTFHSKDIKTTPDGRMWLIDPSGNGRNKRIYKLSDGTYTTIDEVMQKVKGMSIDTARIRLSKTNDPEKIYAKMHERRSEWRQHIKIKSRITPEQEKEKMILDELNHLLYSFK